MYERLTKWIPTMKSYEGDSSASSWMWPKEFSEFLDDLSAFRSPFGGICLKPEEIGLAVRDKEFLDSLEGAVIVSAMRDVFGADRIVEGTVNNFASAGGFHKFLVRLKELDEGKPIVKPKKEYAYHKRAVIERAKEEEERKRRKEVQKRWEEERKRQEARKPLDRAIDVVLHNGETTDLTADIDMVRRSAEAGDVEAQYAMGHLYANGRHGEGVDIDQDSAEAVKWYRIVAGRNEQTLFQKTKVLWAQLHLGRCYFEGDGVEKNEVEAANWYRKSAEGGCNVSQYMLGLCYENGWGVEQDCTVAAIWHHKAARNGLAEAQYRMGVMYLHGVGVEEDFENALAWFQLAAESGNEDAAKVLKSVDDIKRKSLEAAKASCDPPLFVEIVFKGILLLFLFYIMKSCSG